MIFIALFLYGVTKLLALRFEEGDVYPAYSSLRYDPLGTRALFEGLETILKNSIKRNYDSPGKIDTGQNSTLMYLGTVVDDPIFNCEKPGKALKRFAAERGRVVISLLPVTRIHSLKNTLKNSKTDPEEKKDGPKDKVKEKTSKGKSQAKTKELKKDHEKDAVQGQQAHCMGEEKKSWGFSFGYEDNRTISGNAEFVSGALEDLQLPSVSWHTTLFFDNLGKEWKVIYSRNSHPVIIERKLGKGSLVLTADSYFFSNEALLKERRPELLSWIIGESTRVIFDESHLGIQKNPGIASLGRKYNLQWLFLGLIFFGLLFVWKNSAYFVPPPEKPDDEGTYDSGPSRDYKEGLISLLKRNIHKEQLLRICEETWEKSISGDRAHAPEAMETISRIKAVIESEGQRPRGERSTVNAYQEICNILSKRKIL